MKDSNTFVSSVAMLDINLTRRVILSDEQRTIVEVVVYVFLCGGVSVFGIVSNIINIIIFFRQGLKTTMNISFFGLAISDLCSLLNLLCFTIFLNPLVERSNLPIVSREFQYLVAGWPYVCFTRITSLITAFMTAERCLCITCPLKVKNIITPKRAAVVICSTYVIIFFFLLPEYATSYIDWKFYPPRNKTLLRLVFTSNRKSMEGLVFILNACLGALSYLLVVVFTAVLIYKLKRNSKWRKENNKDFSDQTSSRDNKAVTMVLLIAAFLIVCSAPSIVLSLVSFFLQEFSVLGFHSNIFFAVWSIAFFFGAINSSVNIFLYYKMSSKFRRSFKALFSKVRRRADSSAQRTKHRWTFVGPRKNTSKNYGADISSDNLSKLINSYRCDSFVLTDFPTNGNETSVKDDFQNSVSAEDIRLGLQF
ncbi:thyrotropin-releasing hormone receptor-like [Biomphalaria glabrata]|uniref:Thyrotropin-releasing hormone receptor-like n=1 Tax=Biomphalaria glabrata TaxID=6526 RepID=A0A9W3AU26_BIOGL|nr:thyrotropin-releasing hormone receptor-like [Biomphalaria glabrata]